MRRTKREATRGTYPSRYGFTLIELLVVISIIALMMSISLPALTQAQKEGEAIHCLANERTLTLAWMQYALDNDDEGGIAMNQRVITVQADSPEHLAGLMDEIVGSVIDCGDTSEEIDTSIACFQVIENDYDGLFTAVVVMNTAITITDSPEWLSELAEVER